MFFTLRRFSFAASKLRRSSRSRRPERSVISPFGAVEGQMWAVEGRLWAVEGRLWAAEGSFRRINGPFERQFSSKGTLPRCFASDGREFIASARRFAPSRRPLLRRDSTEIPRRPHGVRGLALALEVR